MSAELEAMLQQLQGMGRLDSQGGFSMDSQRARLLLEKYRLPAATYFMLHAVGAAVCSRASRVEIQLRADRFELTFDGDPFSAENVEGCFSSLWSNERDHRVMRLRELAIARGGAADWGASEFTLGHARDGRQQIRVRKQGLTARFTLLLGRMGRHEEESMLRQHLVPTLDCRLVLNGEPIEELSFPRKVQQAAVWRYDGAVGEVENPTELDLSALDPELVREARGVVCRLPDHDRSPSKLRAYWPGYLDLILNGRLYRCQLPPTLSNCWGIFWLSGLRRDLSHTFIAAEDLAIFYRLFNDF